MADTYINAQIYLNINNYNIIYYVHISSVIKYVCRAITAIITLFSALVSAGVSDCVVNVSVTRRSNVNTLTCKCLPAIQE
jgi:hypothetical protein